jgi:hypothetical protein
MEQISKIVEASTIGTQQSAKACQDLSQLTHNLQNLVERFHFGGDHAPGTHQNLSASMPSGSRQDSQSAEEQNSIHGGLIQ